jgi:hypothetical protein
MEPYVCIVGYGEIDPDLACRGFETGLSETDGHAARPHVRSPVAARGKMMIRRQLVETNPQQIETFSASAEAEVFFFSSCQERALK